MSLRSLLKLRNTILVVIAASSLMFNSVESHEIDDTCQAITSCDDFFHAADYHYDVLFSSFIYMNNQVGGILGARVFSKDEQIEAFVECVSNEDNIRLLITIYILGVCDYVCSGAEYVCSGADFKIIGKKENEKLFAYCGKSVSTDPELNKDEVF